jgi:PST family polysaccharide transporter
MITERFRVSSTLREIIENTGWLFGLRIVRIIFAIFVTAWVARYLGRENYGILNYGLAFMGLFSPLAVLGLQGLVVRDIVREPEAKDEILGTTFLLRLAGGVLAMLLVLVAIRFVRAEEPLVRLVTGIVSVILVFRSFDSIDIWFQSQVRSKYTVIARSSALAVGHMLKIAAILTGKPLVAFAVIAVIDAAAGGAGLVIAYRIQGQRIRRWRFSAARARELLSQCWSLVLTGTLAIIYLKIDQVMLGGMAGDAEVGVYSTAVRLSEVWYFIPIAITTSVFPALIRSRERGAEVYKARLQQLYDFLAWVAIAVALVFTFAASHVILLLFGEQYRAAGPILAVHIWAGLFVFLKAALGRWLLNEGEMRFLFISNGLGAAVNILLNLVLIPLYGGMGAALATVVSYACAGLFSCFLYRSTRQSGWMITKAIFVPFRALAGILRRP